MTKKEKGQQLQGENILQFESQESNQSQQKDQLFELKHVDVEVKYFCLYQSLLHTLFNCSLSDVTCVVW